MVECPLCGEEVGDLEGHVWERHTRRWYVPQRECWCNYVGLCHELMAHWRKNGGVLEHYLSFHLGGSRDA